MNSLSLRVSSVKSGENVRKNAEMRAILVTLPRKYENSEQTYCLAVRNAKTIPEQVSAVKDIFKTLGSDAEALQFLADLFFHSPLKHPLRNQILKLLITAARLGTGGVDESQIISALSRTQQQVLEDTKAETESLKWNFAVTSLASCFENFDCGLKALEHNISIVFPFLCASVQKYLTELGVLSSPSVRNEYYLYIHNSIRFMLSCVQEFPQKLNATHNENLRQVNQICKQIIVDDDIPMDPRTNSGILIAHISKLFGEYETLIQEVKLTKNANEIALCVGIINTCGQQDFQHNSGDLRDICSKIDEIANANATAPQILLCASRALYQISKLILNLDLKTVRQPTGIDDAKLILRKLLIFAFGFLEHHMDSVRHICRDLLRNIIAAAKKIQFVFLQQKIYDACNSERLSLSMKCIVLQQASSVLGAAQIIENCPGLFTGLFATHLGRDFIVNNLYEGLMSASHKELNYEIWYKQWIEYLLKIASTNDSRLPDIEILIVKAVKCEPKIVQKIIVEKPTGEILYSIPISTKLSALWAVRKSGINMPNFNDIMQKFGSNLMHSILVNCDETRIMALRLLVETHKTTELLTALECDHLLNYLEYNVNCQNPATRQKSLALLGKALIRCELNLVKILKETKTKHNDTTHRPLQLRFLLEFIRLLVGNLFRGANFSRRSVSLQLLQQSVQICINCNLDLEQIFPQHTISILVESLGDSYETNKELSVNILKLIEDKLEYSLIQKYKLSINLMETHGLLVSVRPTDSITAAYQLDFICNRSESAKFGEFETPAYSPTYYAALRWLVLTLRDGLKIAKNSILQAAKLNPLYGSLFAVKHLLKQLDFQILSQDLAWRILIAELILLCKELTNVVAPVVNSSSPEGHLPNDFGELPAEFTESLTEERPSSASSSPTKCNILSKRSRKVNLNAIKTTPQMVLLCAWRTVKEVSLILGEIVLHSPIQYSKLTEQFLITKEQILEIGEHFKLLLSETKHRGAFEQAYVGFSKLCCRLWRVEVVDLNSLPLQWLREMISLISRDEQINEKICATRRSAGVPFMVQALITSELQVGSTKALFYCMSHLIHLCNNTDRSAESRTHALNILRALFRCTELNEAVGEFVADGIICAIRAYNSNTWSERNSGTLLFAALITRIFGVQRTKDSENLNIRNKMTGRIFFLRYPKLYDFFLEQLKQCRTLVKEKQKAHKLHPLLLILSRLYPSALEGTESNLKLSEFIPHIMACAGCPEMQTRFLAAKAVVALISKDETPITMLRKCASILTSADDPEDLRLNMLHAHLLQLLLLVKMHKNLDVELVGDIARTIVTFHSIKHIENAVIMKAMLDIYVELLNGLSSLTTFSLDTKKDLLYFVTQKHLHAAKLSFIYPVFRKSFYIYNLHTLRLTLPFGAISDYLLNPPIIHNSVTLEEAETRLNIILLVLIKHKPQADISIMEEIEITTAEQNFVEDLDPETLSELATELRQSQFLQNELKNLLENPLYYPECVMKSYAILSMLDHFDMSLSQLLRESKKHPGDVKSLLTLCVERLVLKQGVDYKVSQACLEYLLEISQPWNPDCLRLKASRILGHIAVHYRKALEKKKLIFVRLYISLILSLLMDDDFDIRDNTTRIVIRSLSDNIEMDSVVPTMAQRLFLQLTADILKNLKADDTFILDIFKMITDTLTISFTSDDENINSSSGGSINSNNAISNLGNDFEVFDRNESNVFAEPLKAVMDCAVVFKTTFSERSKIVSFVNNYKSC